MDTNTSQEINQMIQQTYNELRLCISIQNHGLFSKYELYLNSLIERRRELLHLLPTEGIRYEQLELE